MFWVLNFESFFSRDKMVHFLVGPRGYELPQLSWRIPLAGSMLLALVGKFPSYLATGRSNTWGSERCVSSGARVAKYHVIAIFANIIHGFFQNLVKPKKAKKEIKWAFPLFFRNTIEYHLPINSLVIGNLVWPLSRTLQISSWIKTSSFAKGVQFPPAKSEFCQTPT